MSRDSSTSYPPQPALVVIPPLSAVPLCPGRGPGSTVSAVYGQKSQGLVQAAPKSTLGWQAWEQHPDPLGPGV